MRNSYQFLSFILDSITEHIVVINETGEIEFVNKGWLIFGSENACDIGDESLKKVGKLLKKITNRPGDIYARYGGDEFALVLGDTTLDQAKQLSKKLLGMIIGLQLKANNSHTNNYLTASIGLAELVPARGQSESELIGKADNMLYKAKENGRNRIEC